MHLLNCNSERDIVDDVFRLRLAFTNSRGKCYVRCFGINIRIVDGVRFRFRIRWYDIVAVFRNIDLNWVTIKFGISEFVGCIPEIHDRKVRFPILFSDSGSATDDLFELDRRIDYTIEDDQLAGFGINTGAHQPRCSGDNGVTLFRADEVVEFLLAFFFIAGNSHHVFTILRNEFGQLVGQRDPHSFGVVNVVAEDDGFGVWISAFEVVSNLFRHQLGPLLHHDVVIEVF